MLSKIKIGLAIFSTLIIGFLYAAFRVQKSDKEKAEAKIDEIVRENQTATKIIEVEHEIKSSKDHVDIASNDDIDVMLSKYNRSRKD